MPQSSSARRDDLALVRRLLDGEEAAFDQLAEECFPPLYRFALSRLGHDEETAADIVQSTLTSAMRSLERFRGDSALLTWLCGICRFEISGMRRREGRRPQHVELTEETIGVRDAVAELSRRAGDQHDALERDERTRRVHEVLDALPPRYGQALEWKYLHDLSVKDIAARLELSPKAAESVLTRARNAFSKRFTLLMDGAGENLLQGHFSARDVG